jgi:hypothetical protein
VDWEVERHVAEFIKGIPYDNKGMPVYERFYVHPENGLLCENTEYRRRWRRQERQKKYVPGDNENQQYHCINGVWYEVELSPFPPQVKTAYGWSSDYVNDVLLRKKNGSTSRSECRAQYGRDVYATKKRQINSKEIKKLKLWETPQGKAARMNHAA